MAWRVARSLDVLLGQLNAARPDRAKASDGAIGDTAHSNRSSDHNPWYGPGIVTARDFTHDPARGVVIAVLADQLLASRDGRIKYVIANGRIASGANGPSPWAWRAYSGPNPHTKHLHLSVVAAASADDPRLWALPFLGTARPAEPVPVPPAPSGLLRRGSTGARVTQLQKTLNAWYPWLRLRLDGDFGPATENAVRELQRRAGLAVDGIAGPRTLAVLNLA